MKNKKEKRKDMNKVKNSPIRVISSDRPHPPRNKRGGPVLERVLVGGLYRGKKVTKYLFAVLGSLLTNMNSVGTVAGWNEWDDFRNEETRTDFIINTLTTQEKWRQRGPVAHMGWHIPDILLILYKEGFCSAGQILKIVKGFEGCDITRTPNWSDTTQKLRGPLPDMLYQINVDGPVKFGMEFAHYTTPKGEERCYIGSTAYNDKPSLMQWWKTNEGTRLVEGWPKWNRYDSHDTIGGKFTMSPREIERKETEKRKAESYRAREALKKIEKAKKTKSTSPKKSKANIFDQVKSGKIESIQLGGSDPFGFGEEE